MSERSDQRTKNELIKIAWKAASESKVEPGKKIELFKKFYKEQITDKIA